MGIRDLLKKHSSKSSNASTAHPSPCRTITVQTNHGSLKITNLKRVWSNSSLGTYRLMYSDDKNDFNCIYSIDIPWDKFMSFSEYVEFMYFCDEFMHFCANRLIDAYKNGDSFIEL